MLSVKAVCPCLAILMVTTAVLAAEKEPECQCFALGTRWNQGEDVCLNGRVNTCGMNQNVASWIATSKACKASDGTT